MRTVKHRKVPRACPWQQADSLAEKGRGTGVNAAARTSQSSPGTSKPFGEEGCVPQRGLVRRKFGRGKHCDLQDIPELGSAHDLWFLSHTGSRQTELFLFKEQARQSPSLPWTKSQFGFECMSPVPLRQLLWVWRPVSPFECTKVENKARAKSFGNNYDQTPYICSFSNWQKLYITYLYNMLIAMTLVNTFVDFKCWQSNRKQTQQEQHMHWLEERDP